METHPEFHVPNNLPPARLSAGGAVMEMDWTDETILQLRIYLTGSLSTLSPPLHQASAPFSSVRKHYV